MKYRSKRPIIGGDLAYAGTSFDLKPVPHEDLEEHVVHVGLESEEKEGDLDNERYIKIIK